MAEIRATNDVEYVRKTSFITHAAGTENRGRWVNVLTIVNKWIPEKCAQIVC